MSQHTKSNPWPRLLMIASLAVSLLMLTVANKATQQARAAVQQAEQSQRSAHAALARQFGAQAQSLSLMVNPRYESAYLLAIQSMRLDPNADAAQILLESPLSHPQWLFESDGSVTVMALSADARYVATGHTDGRVRVHELAGGAEVFHGDQGAAAVFIRFTPDGKYLVSSTGWDVNSLHVWEILTGQEIVTLKYDDFLQNVRTVAMSPDGRYMIPLVSDDKGITVINLKTGETIRRFSQNDPAFEGLGTVSFSPDGQYILTLGGHQNSARVWDVSTGDEVAHMNHAEGGFVASFSPDGKYVVSAAGSTAHVWEALTGKEVARMTHDGYAYRAIFNADGTLVASGGYDGSVRIWESTSGHETMRMPLEYYLQSLAFSPDGRYLLATEGGNIVPVAHVWEISTGHEIARIRAVDIIPVEFSPDGKTLVSVSKGTPRVWQYLPEDLIDTSCSTINRNLSQFEWKLQIGDALPYQAVCPNLPIELTPSLITTTTPTAFPTSTP